MVQRPNYRCSSQRPQCQREARFPSGLEQLTEGGGNGRGAFQGRAASGPGSIMLRLSLAVCKGGSLTRFKPFSRVICAKDGPFGRGTQALDNEGLDLSCKLQAYITQMSHCGQTLVWLSSRGQVG